MQNVYMTPNPVASRPLRGKAVTLRLAREADIPDLHSVLQAPEVARWWGDSSQEQLLADLQGGDFHTLVIEVEGRTAGILLYSEELDPEYRHAGMDIALAPEYHGRGLGQDALRTMARYLFEELGHHRLTIDPAAANEHAIETYRRVGFRPVGVMRQYELGADGSWHDGLLMDLLRGEFVPS